MARLPQEFLWQNKLRTSTGGLGCEVVWGLCCTAVHLDKSTPRCWAELLCLKKVLEGQAERSNSPAGHLPGLGNATEPGSSLQCLHHLLWGTPTNLWKKNHTSKHGFGLFPILSMHQCMILLKTYHQSCKENHTTFNFLQMFSYQVRDKDNCFWGNKNKKRMHR